MRDPLVGEFFATSAIRGLAESIVREGIQNALDAGIRNASGRFEDPVKIRIAIHRGATAAPASRHARFFAGIWPHVSAPRNGLEPEDTPEASQDCPFLVFEDFNTCGLVGDVAQDRDLEDVRNPFFYFFRAEGRSVKSGDERGRWGVGKYVFPRASRIKTVFGFTRRADDDRTLLMGASILRSHSIGDQDFLPDGLFGRRKADDGYFVLPEEDSRLLADFQQTFRISRAGETGLSLVVPWIDDSVTKEAIVAAVVSGYFVPLLEGSLVVSVCDGQSCAELTADSFAGVARHIGEKDTAILASLADWGVNTKPEGFVQIPAHHGNKPEWSDELLPADILEKIRGGLEQGSRRVALNIPIRVRRKRTEAQQSFFKVFLEQDRGSDGKPVFVRDGILISDVRSPRDAGVRSIILVDDKPLSTMLGDAENPAHTQWQADSSNFRGKYDYDTACLRFIVRSVHEILSRLTSEDQKGDPWLLSDVFYLKDAAGDVEGMDTRKASHNDTDRTKPRIDDIPPSNPKFYRIQSSRGGFSLTLGSVPPASLPRQLLIRLAYDVRKGNPFTKYAEDDFRVLAAPIRVEGKEQGLKLMKADRNELLVEIRSNLFGVALTGFDTRRDLIVNVQEVSNDDTQD